MGDRTQHANDSVPWVRKDMIAELLSAALNIMDNWGDIDSNSGLCGNIDAAMPTYCPQEYLHSVFEKWPEYSGNEYYPVPAPGEYRVAEGDYDPAMGIYEYSEYNKYSGEYGEARKRLLAFIIKTAQNDLENEDAV